MAHQRYSEQEWKELVLKFESRKISSTEFCKLHNISRAMMYKWRDHFKEEVVVGCKSSSSCGSNDSEPLPSLSGASESNKLGTSNLGASKLGASKLGNFIPLKVISLDDKKIAALPGSSYDKGGANKACDSSISTSITSSMLEGLGDKGVQVDKVEPRDKVLSVKEDKESLSNFTDHLISSSFNIRKESFVLEFDSGCKISDLGAILEVVNAIK